ncbi:MAG TPA: M66 family metalloprotease, partial [Longimicrobiales bacterium]|nr:M66 family metalloprotease [Longimicrobiales bacterium]
AEVNAGNLEQLLASTRRMLPVEDVETTIRTPFSTEEDLSTPTGWSALLSDLQALRTAENAADEYYHGIIRNFSGIAYGGLAYVPGSNGSSFRTALSVEHPDVIVHELGHNLGRPHSPCGGAGGPDPGYPHPDAMLGGPGYDVVTDQLIADPAYRDFMSYCAPEWTSDYTFQRILDWRTDDPRVPAGSVAASAGPRVRGLLLWGRVGPDGVYLNPALELEAPRPTSASGGSSVLSGFGPSGEEIFRVAVEAVPVADGDPAEAHFATFVPLGAAALAALDRVEVQTPVGTARRVAAADADRTDAPAVLVRPSGPDQVLLEWDAVRHPIALVRDRASGAIVAFARGGEAIIATPVSDPAQLLVDLSDGVRTRRALSR